MKKFEHLFSCDPMGAFEKIEDDYARYFEHAFKVKNEAVDEERMNTLKEGVNMSKTQKPDQDRRKRKDEGRPLCLIRRLYSMPCFVPHLVCALPQVC